MTLQSTVAIQAVGITPGRLRAIRARGQDEHGNHLVSLVATGTGEPLRCCLRYAAAGEEIMLISYAHLPGPSVWREVGPVYVHRATCAGFAESGEFPEDFAVGPFVLRTYDHALNLDYEHITLVAAGDDVERRVRGLLADPAVGTVHVRAVKSQCFLFEVAQT